MENLTRRAVLVGACGTCAVALAGCATYGSGTAAAPPAAPAGGGAATGGGTGGGGAASAALASTSDIPVGGGKIFADRGVVVTQPAAGTFKAFTTTCTHQGCSVDTVAGGTINCPCHGSKYKIEDGSVAGGPAPRPLAEKSIAVSGTSITLA